MEDKKDPVTPEMILWLRHKAESAGFTSIIAATTDWAALELSAGFRISEYGQSSKRRFLKNICSYAMDLRQNSHALLFSETLSSPMQIHGLCIPASATELSS